MKLFLDDDELDGQLQRSVSHAYERAADIGEVLAVAGRLAPGDDESWHRDWTRAAQTASTTAHQASDAGHRVTAAEAFLRAVEYYRQAMFYLRADLDDPRLRQAYRDMREAFNGAARQLDIMVRPAQIPYDATTLNGYLYAPGDTDTAWPAVLFPMGYDAPAEDSYLYAAPAVRRGYAVLAFEGPGQGGVLYEQRLFLRPDFEHVLTQVVDHALTLPEVDGDRLILFGRSFAGYLSPRGASSEHRIAALVCDPGQVDLGARILERVPPTVAAMVHADDPAVDELLAPMLASPAARRLWTPRMAAHGATTLRGYLRELMRYNHADRAAEIRCPTLVTETEGDFAGGQSQQLFGLLSCPKSFHVFRRADGAEGHMGGLAQQLWNGFVFDWLHTAIQAAALGTARPKNPPRFGGPYRAARAHRDTAKRAGEQPDCSQRVREAVMTPTNRA